MTDAEMAEVSFLAGQAWYVAHRSGRMAAFGWQGTWVRVLPEDDYPTIIWRWYELRRARRLLGVGS